MKIFAEPDSDDRQRVCVTAFSLQIDWPISGDPCPPEVVVGGSSLQPASPPTSPVGIQAVVLDPDAPGTPVLNAYYCLPANKNWSTTYEEMWTQFAQDATAAQQPGRALLVATFGLDADMPPNEDALGALQVAGGNGAGLTAWLGSCDPGSMAGRTNGWISYPTAYVLVGVFGQRQGAALELVSRTGVHYWLQPPYPVNRLQVTV